MQTVFEIVAAPFTHCGFEARFYKFSIRMPCFHESIFRTFRSINLHDKKFELMLTRRAKAYSSSGSVL